MLSQTERTGVRRGTLALVTGRERQLAERKGTSRWENCSAYFLREL